MNQFINPPSLHKPIGFSYGVRCEGTLLFLSGSTAAGSDGTIQGRGDIVKQFDIAMANIAEVMKEAGGGMQDIVKLTYFVIDRDAYVANLKAIGEVYRRYFGKHFCAQSLFGVTALYEEDALIEIEAIACISDSKSKD